MSVVQGRTGAGWTLLRRWADEMRTVRDVLLSPVLAREVVSGLRERRIMVSQTIYVLGLVTVTLIVISNCTWEPAPHRVAIRPEAGRIILFSVFAVQWVCMLLAAPSFTCGLLSTERERKTYEMLVTSLLSPAQIVGGKLLYGLANVLFLLTSSVPVAATVFFLGGVSPQEIAIYYGILFVTGLFTAQMSLLFSAREQRTNVATLRAYATVVLLVVAGFYVTASWMSGPMGHLLEPLFRPEAASWTFDYHGTRIPYLALPLVTVAWLSAYFFLRSMCAIQMHAKYVLWIQRAFIYWGFTASVLAALWLVATPDSGFRRGYSLSEFWSAMALAALFFLGLFTNSPQFTSRRDAEAWRRALSSRGLFFPLILGIIFCLPMPILYGEGVNLAPLVNTGAVVTVMMGAFLAFARFGSAVTRERVKHTAWYFALLAFALVCPLFSLNISSTYVKTSVWTFFYASPFTAVASIWEEDYRTLVMVGQGPVEVWTVNIIFYLGVIVVFGIATIVVQAWRKRGQPRDAAQARA